MSATHKAMPSSMTGLFAEKQDLSIKKMLIRMFGASRFKSETFKELKDDPHATLQSFLLVPITGLCYGLGLSLFGLFVVGFSASTTVLITLLGLVLGCSIALIWSLTSFLIVNKLFNRTISYLSLARPFFFSWSPGLLFILLLIPNPLVSEGVRVLASAWVGVASVFAVKHAGGLSFQQSMMTFIISILTLVLAQIILESLLPSLIT